MQAIRREAVLVEDGRIWITDLPYKGGERVEIIVVPRGPEGGPRPRLTAGKLRRSGLLGLWEDRTDVDDGVDFARKLRNETQRTRP